MRNIVEEIRPGCRNLVVERSLIIVNLSLKYYWLGCYRNTGYRYQTSELKSILVCWFKNIRQEFLL